ncbi:TPA: hypothetical protein U0908_000628 [Streptococcus suis 14A]|uniref:HeH/LEM domain-containing protein n=1 Tax=Streptococcus suis TaxID=1307 RepID=UPI00040C5751|nr:HeH/LEM domain-containing protein [Streptococcus suis]HEM3198466.1 hypothetical protein [Streptococcus suis 14A]
MGYKTTHAILDSLDNDQYYYGGAVYPRPGLVVSQERLDELVEKGAIVAVDEVPAQPDEEETVEVEEELDDQTVDEVPAQPDEEETVEVEEELDDQTVPEIKAALDKLGIKYSSRASKAELLELLKGA